MESILGIRLYPPKVEFLEADSEVLHQMSIYAQNLGKSSKKIRFVAPLSKHFNLKCKYSEKTIAPGLEVSALIEYYNDKDEDCKDRVLVMIDDEAVEIPVYAYAPKAFLEISGSVDFGAAVADGQVLTREVAILNHGSRDGSFTIQSEDALPFRIIPMEGTIHSGYSQPVRFEFTCKSIGKVKKKIKVNLEGQQDAFIRAQVNVVARSLQLLDEESNRPIDCIRFGCCYYGTDIMKNLKLYNAGPERVSFVSVLDEDADGQELVSNLIPCLEPVILHSYSKEDVGFPSLEFQTEVSFLHLACESAHSTKGTLSVIVNHDTPT